MSAELAVRRAEVWRDRAECDSFGRWDCRKEERTTVGPAVPPLLR